MGPSSCSGPGLLSAVLGGIDLVEGRAALQAVLMVGGDVSDSASSAAADWADALGAPVRLSGSAAACAAFRATTDFGGETLGPDVEVVLPDVDDRYVRESGIRVWNWRPLGTKSGPNLQWARTLSAVGREGTSDWVLLLEHDTSPVGPRIVPRVFELLARYPGAWVIGALPEPSSIRRIDPRFRRHLNGVALYRVGDGEFLNFLDAVWIPSLSLMLQQQSNLAFDLLTSPETWGDLPDPLRASWKQQAGRFVRTRSIVNASATRRSRLTKVLEQVDADENVWLLHAKRG